MARHGTAPPHHRTTVHGPRARNRRWQALAGLSHVEPPFQKDGSIGIIRGRQKKIGKKMEKMKKKKCI